MPRRYGFYEGALVWTASQILFINRKENYCKVEMKDLYKIIFADSEQYLSPCDGVKIQVASLSFAARNFCMFALGCD